MNIVEFIKNYDDALTEAFEKFSNESGFDMEDVGTYVKIVFDLGIAFGIEQNKKQNPSVFVQPTPNDWMDLLKEKPTVLPYNNKTYPNIDDFDLGIRFDAQQDSIDTE